MKRYRDWNPTQAHLLPPSPTEWLPDGHLAYFILDILRELDLGDIIRAMDARDARGARPYSPYMMTALLLYGYSVGVFSSRRIERATYEDVAFRVIAGGDHPDFTRISEFRRKHLAALGGLFEQTVLLAKRMGLVQLGKVAVDGTKIQANASKHKAMSYERMLKEDMKALLQTAEEVDQAEDERFGEGQRDEDLPAELRHREERLAKIREAKRQLEAEAKQSRLEQLEKQAQAQEKSAEQSDDPVERKRAATRAQNAREKARQLEGGADDDDLPPPSPPKTETGFETHRTKATPEGKPHPKAQYNFTDPDSRIQESGGAFLQGYNCQAAVDDHCQIIVAQGVTNLQPDNAHLQPLLEQVSAICGAEPQAALADAGYWSLDNVRYAEAHGIDLYVATERTRRGRKPPDGPVGTKSSSDPREQMRRKLATPEGREIYDRRKEVVEPVFGQTKEARGFRRFLLRGLKKVTGEWALLNATHNLLKIHRYAGAAV